MTRADLTALIISIINTNGANEITGADDQGLRIDIIDNVFVKESDTILDITGMPVSVTVGDVGKHLEVTGAGTFGLSSDVPYTNVQIDAAITAAVDAAVADKLSQEFTNAKRTPTNTANVFTVDSSSEGKTAYTNYPEAILLQFTSSEGLPTAGASIILDSLGTTDLKDQAGGVLGTVLEGVYWGVKDTGGDYRLVGVGSGSGHTIQDNTAVMPQRSNLNFVGATVTDDAGNDATIVDIGAPSYISTTFTSETSVTVAHNIGEYPLVTVLNSLENVIIPLSIVHNSLNDYTVTFTGTETGTILTSVGAPTQTGGVTNTVIVASLNDLPAPVANVITLLDNTIYKFTGIVDIGVNELVVGANSSLEGNFAELDQITSSTTNAVITATNASVKFKNIRINATASTGISLTGTGAENALFDSFTIVASSLGTITDYSVFDIDKGNFIGISGGLTVTGAMLAISLQGGAFYNATGSGLDITGVTADILNIHRMYFNNNASATGLTIASSGANMNAGKEGILAENSFLDASNAIVGYSPFDLEWSAYGNEVDSILTSDRAIPQGWEYVEDGETTPATISATTTPAQLLIDGLGASTDELSLPKSIRGTGNLWDKANDKITPITERDSYDLRIQVGFASLVSNPTTITLRLDIGATPDGTGGAGSIIVATDTKTVKGLTDPVIFSFPIFCKSTFMANGGTLWLETDTGTANIDSRTILITRTSSGAS